MFQRGLLALGNIMNRSKATEDAMAMVREI